MAATAFGLKEQRVGSSRYYTVTLPDVTPKPEDLSAAGAWEIAKIRERTVSSVDWQGRPFAPYSPMYALRKGSSLVNLIGDVTKGSYNHMIDALSHQESSVAGGARLDVGVFNDERNATLAEINNDGATLRTRSSNMTRRRFKGKKDWLSIPARHFLDFSGEDLDQVTQMAGDAISKRTMGEKA